MPKKTNDYQGMLFSCEQVEEQLEDNHSNKGKEKN